MSAYIHILLIALHCSCCMTETSSHNVVWTLKIHECHNELKCFSGESGEEVKTSYYIIEDSTGKKAHVTDFDKGPVPFSRGVFIYFQLNSYGFRNSIPYRSLQSLKVSRILRVCQLAKELDRCVLIPVRMP